MNPGDLNAVLRYWSKIL